MEEMKKRLQELMNEKQQHQEALLKIENEMNEIILKLMESAVFTQENPEVKTETKTDAQPPEDITKYQAFVKIQFKPNGRTYEYLWNHNFEPKEVVVEGMYGEQRVEVVSCYRRKKVPTNINYREAHPIKE